jgi:hypothetical protein
MSNNIEQTYLSLKEQEEYYYNRYEECLEQIDYYTSKGWPNKYFRQDLYDWLKFYSGAAISRAEDIADMEAENPELANIKINHITL